MLSPFYVIINRLAFVAIHFPYTALQTNASAIAINLTIHLREGRNGLATDAACP
jgi:hypothetical protein